MYYHLPAIDHQHWRSFLDLVFTLFLRQVGLALAAVGNLATADMARDLASEIMKLLNGASPYLRKKAALTSIRVLKKWYENYFEAHPMTDFGARKRQFSSDEHE
jgi:hypothetical protein